MTWDTTAPAGSDDARSGDDEIRTFKTDIQTSLRGNTTEGLEAVFPGSDTSNPVFRYRGLKGDTSSRPASGQYGFYFDTDKNTLFRDNGSTWDEIGTSIASGTKMIFYQASAPTGWTAVAVNNKFLRVVTAGGTGGTTGGTMDADTNLMHNHTVNSHTHDLGNHTHSTPAHQHDINYSDTTGSGATIGTEIVSSDSSGSALIVGDGGSASDRTMLNNTTSSGSGTSGAPSSNTSGSASPDTDSIFSGAFAYADIIIATKD